MSRRVIDVAIRSEFRKGFGDVARQMEALTRQLKSVEGLQNSVNKLADKFDRASTYKNATENAKKFAGNQKSVNKTLDDGVKIANRYESAQTKLARSLGALTASQRSGSISNKQRIEAEIGLLNQYIKKTKDLSVLDSRKTYRGAKGQFTAFTKDALRSVSDSLAKATETGLRTGSQKGATQLVQQMRATTARIKTAVGAITASGYQASFANRGAQAGFYDTVWGSQGKRNGAGLGTQDLINRNTGVRPANSTGMMLGEDTKFNQLKLQYQQLEQKAASTSGRVRRMNFGPNPALADSGFKKIFDSYNRLGHFLFQLQYSTMTLFGLSGVGMILNQADAYITLRNQVARTSESINDLGGNMQDVYRIAMTTFSDVKGVGKIFSTINKFSGDLGLDRRQVGNVTEAISGAFAASPGNAQEKAASQYQFMQAIQSNRLGGDELRSVLEMAPYVGDILGKGIARNRGMPEGSVIDLRAQGKGPNPIDAKEIVAVFNNPQTQAEIRKTIGEQARTFGDMMMVAKTRLMMMTEQFNNSTGIFNALTRMISSFLGNDVMFDKFTQAIQFATAALVVYGGMLGVQAAGKGIGKLAQGASGLVSGRGLFSPASVRLAGMQTDKLGAGIAAGAGAIRSGSGAALGAVSTGLNAIGSSAMMLVRSPLPTLGKAFTGVGGLIARTAGGIAGSFGRLLGALRGLNFATILTSVLRGAGVALNLLVRGMFAFQIPLIAIAAIVAALVIRFNQLFGKMSGGMNIMDILRGTWEMLMDSLRAAGDFLSNSFLGSIWNAITGFVNGILRYLGQAAMENTYLQEQAANRRYDRNGDGVTVMHGRDGKNYTTRYVNGVLTRTTEEARNSDGSWRQADVNAGDNLTGTAFRRNLPTGQRSGLPAETPGNNSGNKGPKDPWPEFLRDLRLKVQALTDLVDIPEQFRDIKSSFDENRRRAMDVMNFDSSGFDTLTEAWLAFRNTNAAKAQEVDDQNKRLNDLKIADSLRNFISTLRDTMNGLQDAANTSRMGGVASSLFDGRRTLFDQFIASPEAQNTMTETSRQALITQSGGDLAGAIVALTAALTPDGQARFGNALTQSDQLIVDAQAGELEKRARGSRDTLNTQIALQNVFGRQRELQEEILGLQNEQSELTKDANADVTKINEQYAVLIAQVRERAALEESNRRNYATGLTSALAEYRDGLNDLAGDTSSLFSNALKGIEDSLTSLITTGKMNLTDFLAQMQQEVGRLFVRQVLMKPLTGMLDKMFGNMFGMQDQTINANNVFINSTGLGSMMGMGNPGPGGLASFGKSFLPQGGMGSSLGGMLRTGVSMIPGIGPFLAGLFHGGGTVGNASMSRYVNPGVFAGAMKYHTGGTVGMPALGVNEVPAILNRGEKVLTASQYSAMNNGGSSQVFSPSIQVTYHAGNSDGGRGGGSAEDAKAMGAMVKASVDQAIMDYDRRSRRPGSPGYLNNKK